MPAASLPICIAAISVVAASVGADSGADGCRAAGGSAAGPALLQRGLAPQPTPYPAALLQEPESVMNEFEKQDEEYDEEYYDDGDDGDDDRMKKMMKNTTTPEPEMNEIEKEPNSRCHGPPKIGWGNLGKGVSEEECKLACLDKSECEYVVFFVKRGQCTEYSACSTFKRSRKRTCTAWRKDTAA